MRFILDCLQSRRGSTVGMSVTLITSLGSLVAGVTLAVTMSNAFGKHDTSSVLTVVGILTLLAVGLTLAVCSGGLLYRLCRLMNMDETRTLISRNASSVPSSGTFDDDVLDITAPVPESSGVTKFAEFCCCLFGGDNPKSKRNGGTSPATGPSVVLIN